MNGENLKNDKDKEYSQNDREILERKKKIQEFLHNQRKQRNRFAQYKAISEGLKIKEKIEDKWETLKKKDFKQNIELRKLTLIALFGFLITETIAIFYFTWCQALKLYEFHLEEWSFRLLIGATISQVTVMLLIAIKHLFPEKK